MPDPSPTVSSRPRARIRFTSASAFSSLVFGGWMMVFAGGLLWAGCLEVAQELSLRRDGVRTEARVMARRIEADPEVPKQLLTLRYEASMPGSVSVTRYQADASVGAERYEQLTPGQDVAILHSRTHPWLFRLADSPPYGGITLISIGGMLTIFGGFFVVGGLWGFWELVLLACRGDIQHGWLVDRWEEITPDLASNFCVSYRFLTASGDQRTGAEVNRRAFLDLQPGSPVKVRTVRGRPDICWLQL